MGHLGSYADFTFTLTPGTSHSRTKLSLLIMTLTQAGSEAIHVRQQQQG